MVFTLALSLCKFHNRVVHAVNMKENNEKILAELHMKVTEEYRNYAADPFIVSPKFNSLLLKKALEDRQHMG